MPKGLLAAFGIVAGPESFAAFLSSEFFSLLWVLALGYYAVAQAAWLPAGMLARRELTALLMTPLGRARLVAAGAAAVLTEIFLLTAVSVLATGLLGRAYGIALCGMHLWLFGLAGFLLLALFGALAILCAAVLSDDRQTLSAAGGVLLLFYLLDLAAKLSPRLGGLAHLTPFAA